MTQIKTYDDFIKVKDDEALNQALWEAMGRGDRDDKIKEIMKGYVLVPDFDKEHSDFTRILAHRINLHSNMEYIFVEGLLESTLSQYKRKSDKLKFVEDCLRDFGTNNLAYNYNSKSPVATFTGNDENIFSFRKYYQEYLVYMLAEVYGHQLSPYSSPKFKSIDAQIVFGLLAGRNYRQINSSQRFDVDNPLHQKLAAIAMQIEKQTKGSLFKGVTERWEQDTGTEKTRLEKEQDKAIRGRMRDISKDDEEELEILKKIKSGKKVSVKEILGLSAEIFRKISASDLAGMDASDIYEIYASGRGKRTEAQDRAMLELLIKRAPVDKDWYKKFSQYLVWGMYAYDYKLLSLFDKRFGKVAKEIEQDLVECEIKTKEQQKKYDGIYDKQVAVAKQIKEMTQARDAYKYNLKKNREWISEFENLKNSGSEAEREFYSKYYNLLSDGFNLFVSGKSKDHDFGVTEIAGHPWKIFGNKEEKQRLKDAKSTFKVLLNSYKNPPAPWTGDEEKELGELDDKASSLADESMWSRLSLGELDNKYRELSRDKKDFVDRFAKVTENARKEYLKKIESATQAFIEKHGRQPRRPVLTDVREK